MPRFVVALVCVAVAAMAAAPLAMAGGSPAGDQYGSPLPGTGGSGNSSGTGSSGSGTDGSAVIPVAPSSGSSSGSDSSSASSDNGSGKSDNGPSGHNKSDAKGSGNKQPKQSATPDPVVGNQSAHSVPQIAADSAGDSWMPFFIGGLVLLATAFAFLVFFRNRRRTAPN